MRMLSQPFKGSMSVRPSALDSTDFPEATQVSVTSGMGVRVVWSKKVTVWA